MLQLQNVIFDEHVTKDGSGVTRNVIVIGKCNSYKACNFIVIRNVIVMFNVM